ncbi:hypothetical protein [Ligilactobacillus agilis]|uniref:hypothetical protein n=1 Tax=Ligilactobacillus agilis TaxID=1601 RepID=UPI000B8D24DD|nr:hypothetical protein [Ligilactobacillus agilis]ASR41761.1 hypothetical protein BEN83_10060 [Ligilactobacillus agilis]GET17711.1 hypothetical protein PTL465_00290 [Ligilactobacillus agilis]
MEWLTLREVSEKSGISLNTLRQRFKRNYYFKRKNYVYDYGLDMWREVKLTKRDIQINPKNKLKEKLISPRFADVIIQETVVKSEQAANEYFEKEIDKLEFPQTVKLTKLINRGILREDLIKSSLKELRKAEQIRNDAIDKLEDLQGILEIASEYIDDIEFKSTSSSLKDLMSQKSSKIRDFNKMKKDRFIDLKRDIEELKKESDYRRFH